MKVKDLLTSGIIEIYCLGRASEVEKALVEKYASENKEVRDEIISVSEALNQYAMAHSITPPLSIKNKILTTLLNSEKTEIKYSFPPVLTLSSTVSEWIKYISDNKISPPADFGPVHLLDLPGNEKQATYIAWAKKGSVVEETHDDEDEYLLMLKGSCSVTINGKIEYYKEGDVVFVPGKSLHRAEVLSDETMILVGQRIAA